MITSRPVLSVWCPIREGSANRLSVPLRITHRHGWLLCSDGARHANCTVVLITSVSNRVSNMFAAISFHEVSLNLRAHPIVEPGAKVTSPEPNVIGCTASVRPPFIAWRSGGVLSPVRGPIGPRSGSWLYLPFWIVTTAKNVTPAGETSGNTQAMGAPDARARIL